MSFTCSLTIRLLQEEPFFGPGVNELLHQIDYKKSLFAAAASMHMSYSKAWKILNEAEKRIGYPLTSKSIGGVEGGGSVLTEEGRSFMERYDSFLVDASEEVEAKFNTYFPEAKK
ncbi:molybdenum-binding protein [Sphaerochaeta pleomorpha str. Grapes]|uniref:Molybdenum-binding protein n=1 Tax=Sphaerochaeta pleomorpha (strain ATCC BAA-1885 / DSM 22778 / Grapes) TaxID=158190 RepID=G8QTC2_SPHPG|nr:LysR family transcriptional regulator [Sphaerochaeta pleomorpha]AEV29089.1 molybdenum-binding protein [Sphaerochaeta pleomorpha str. Grapes]